MNIKEKLQSIVFLKPNFYLIIFLLSITISGFATTHTVTNINNSGTGSLRDVIYYAGSGDTINFAPSLIASGSATITLTSSIFITNNLTIKGLYNSTDTLYLSGNNSNQIFMSLSSLSLEHLVLKEGSSSFGGALRMATKETEFSLKECIFIHNNASSIGGAIYIDSKTVEIIDCIFQNNTSSGDGGALYFRPVDDSANMIISGSQFINNNTGTYGSGGAIYMRGRDCHLTINNNSVFSNNSAFGSGAIRVFSLTTGFIELENSIFTNNFSQYSSGGIYVNTNDSTLTANINNCEFNGNVCTNSYPGALDLTSTKESLVANITNSTFLNNVAADSSANSFGGGGGALHADAFSTLKGNIVNCTFNNNSSIGDGGAANVSVRGNSYSYGDRDTCSLELDVINSTFVNNSSQFNGGGLWVYAFSNFASVDTLYNVLNVNNSTFYNNSAISDGSQIYVNDHIDYPKQTKTETNLNSSIFADYSGNNVQSVRVYYNRSINSKGYNIFSDSIAGMSSSDQFNITNGQLNLGALANNGGTTQTILPIPYSVASNKGNPVDMQDAQNGPISGGRRDVGAAENCMVITLEDTNYVCFGSDYTWSADGVTYSSDTVTSYVTSPSNPNIGQCGSALIKHIIYLPELVDTLNSTVCYGGSIVVNGTTYNASNLSGTEIFHNVGTNNCDSTVTVNLTVLPQLTGVQNSTVCYGGSIVVNGTTYDASNLSGTEVFHNVGANNCDSTVAVNLTILPELTGTQNSTVCYGGSIVVNGTTYDASNLSGTEVFHNVGANNCDSTVTVNLTVLPQLTGVQNSTVCYGGSIVVNGTTYDASNLSGTEVFHNVGANNCDSTVTVNLTVLPELTGVQNSTVCFGGSIVVNGTTYDASNLSGTEVFHNIGANNCDSTVTVNLTVLPELTGVQNSTVCYGGSIVVNGTTYDASNLSGTEVFHNVGANNCDSTVTVNLTVLPQLTGVQNSTVCYGGSIVVNGTTYDASNLSGIEVFHNIGAYNCDSTVTVNLTVLPQLTGIQNSTICYGGSIVVNGTTYDASHLSGTEVFHNVGTNNCDSTVTVNLTVLPELTGVQNSTVCYGGSIVVNGTTYDASNLSGTEVFHNIGANNCDSTVTVNLTVLPQLTGVQNSTVCFGGSIVVNGTTYDASYLSGTEVFHNVGANNCDSTVTVNLTILPELTGTQNSTVCFGGNIVVNGTTYDASNLSGTEVFHNIGTNNCDSTVTVNLTVLPLLTGVQNSTVCFGGSIVVNGTTYDASNLSGTEVFHNIGAYNCDSTVTVNLTVLPQLTGIQNSTVCYGGSIVVNGTTYDASNLSGIEVFHNIGTNNCDSTVTVNLTVLPQLTGVQNSTVCFGGSIVVNGTTYDASNLSGTEVFHNVGANNCDSTVTVNLTVLPQLTGVQNSTVCYGGSIVVNGTTYDASNLSGIEVFHNIGAYNCDSTVTVNLTVLPQLTGIQNSTICYGGSIVVNGTTYDASNLSGTEVFHNVGTNNCDSTVTVNLTVLPQLDLTVSITDGTVSANQNGASYQWLDCNTNYSVIPDSTFQSFTPTLGGSYAVEITSNSCVDTSNCEIVTPVGLKETAQPNVSIYPNPTNRIITVDFGTKNKLTHYGVYSSNGQEIIKGSTTDNTIIIDLQNVNRGFYFLHLFGMDNPQIFKIIRQ